MSGPYQGRDLSNCGSGRLRVAINCGVLSVNYLQFDVFYGIIERTVDFLQFFCTTKVVWTCIHAYGGEWVN